MTKALSLAALVGVALVPLAANAHHSYSEYDDTKSVEVEGKLVEVAWQNPHARILVESVDAAGARVTWDIESAGVNNFRRMNVPLEIFAVGSTVKIAGWPSKRSNVADVRHESPGRRRPGARDVALLEAAVEREGARLRLRLLVVRNRDGVGI